MKVRGTSIIRTFRGMAAASQWNPSLRDSLRPKQPITFHPTSALANPQNSRFCSEWRLATEELKRTLNGGREYTEDESFGRNAPSSTASEYTNNDEDESSRKNVLSLTAECVVKEGREHNNYEYESLRASAEVSRPRPQEVPWPEELDSKVHFIGRVIRSVVLCRIVNSGRARAYTTLAVKGGGPLQIMGIPLIFFDELAEIAAQHLKKWDTVYVSGYFVLGRRPGEDEKSQTYEVIAQTLNFIENRFPCFSQQAVVKKNNPSLHFSAQRVTNRDPPFQYEKAQVKSSSSGKIVQDYAASIESLWQSLFTSPSEWWDIRMNKTNPKGPDFKHKYTGELLWIHNRSNPSWVKSKLGVLDPEKCE